MASFISKVSSAVAACARRVTHATRRLLRPRRLGRGGSLCLGKTFVPADGFSNGAGAADREEDSQGLWRRAILMGERCEPLDFPGAIHYDSLGQRLQAPRSGSAKAALLCRSSDAVDDAVTASKKAR